MFLWREIPRSSISFLTGWLSGGTWKASGYENAGFLGDGRVGQKTVSILNSPNLKKMFKDTRKNLISNGHMVSFNWIILDFRATHPNKELNDIKSIIKRFKG